MLGSSGGPTSSPESATTATVMNASRPLGAAALLALALLRAVPAPASEAAAPWPESARGRPLPRPSWVLVIPARRAPDGTLSIWRRDDEWTKAWRAPRLVRGIRMVSLFGDAEDRRAVTAEAIDGMLVDSLASVMRKYGAPALALAVTDGQSVALAGYVPGRPASWVPAEVGEDAAATRERSVAALSGLFGAAGAAVAPEASSAPADVEILALRDADGGFDYRLRVRATGEAQARRMLSLAGLELAEAEAPGADGTLVAIASSADGVEGVRAALRGAGLTVR